MKEKKQIEEVQSRRQFFKQAAKKALPVIGAIAFINSPIFAQTMNNVPMSCDNNCSKSCQGRCLGGCTENVCKGGCAGTCSGGCKNSNK